MPYGDEDGIAVTPPEPVEALRIDHKVRQNNIFDIASRKLHEGDTAIDAGDDAVVHGHVADTDLDAVAKLQRAGRGRETAVGNGDVFAGKSRTPPVRGIKHNGVVSCFNRAVDNAQILAPIRVNAVGPHPAPEAAVNIDSVDHYPLASIGINIPAWR